ncbi:hypothetical protein FSC37_21800 [Piscinibacter aquaticus]|uniref:MHYT domain-containing protein n=1 Tax=Piscinibacter aquaticus TaxID=392597 RepID=A0A5C6U5G3_9BURK|nr:hypothetical protein FSC37_21800 [Piscinibacter aquaticus]
MAPDSFLARQFHIALDAAAALLAALACHVGLALNRRVPGASRRGAMPWLAGGALALGTGLWSVHFVTAGLQPLRLPVAYNGFAVLATG